ncbi:Integrin beta-like protein 1 [Dissostichus eleginoides]|uniref:Integrin beta-like protein 1 n=1 Tax=Dissostichus eleginoides TaxID=100907 RepID=A0AAD9CLC5_DISEL|nr:Integrin beta-like protein 1 [Dissostichus eleginoides]
MHTEALVQSILVPLFLILLTTVEDTLLQSVSQVGGVCKFSSESSLRRCRTPDGKICSGRGKCDCGVCICEATDPGKFYGPRCDCHDWVCSTYNGKTCNDRGYCDCGMCECDEGWFGDACQFQEECNLPSKKSKELCKNPEGVVCSNRGTCHCGSCMCNNEDNRGLVTGRFCECDDSECLDEDTGEVCGGHGQCYCGNCYCAAGWHGDKCEFQCDISPWESKRRCKAPDGKICSNRVYTSRAPGLWGWRGDRTYRAKGQTSASHIPQACQLAWLPRVLPCSVTADKRKWDFHWLLPGPRWTCVCGECNCHDVDPSGDWGDIHGDTCECDERTCHATYDRYTDDYCTGHGQCNCGMCDCKEGWAGKKCEHPLSCSLSLESSMKKCQGTSNLPCFGREGCKTTGVPCIKFDCIFKQALVNASVDSVPAIHLETVVLLAKTVSVTTVSARTSVGMSVEVTVTVRADAASARRAGSGSCASSQGHVT